METPLIMQENQIRITSQACPSIISFPKIWKETFSDQVTRENSRDTSCQDDEEELMNPEDIKILEDNQLIQTEDEDLPSCFFQRSNDQARRCYINKLVDMKVLDLKPKKKSQNIYVFDWDDTLFCTSSLGNLSINKIPCELRSALCTLDCTASQLLLKAARNGETFIITNSDAGWVEQSSKSALPKTYEVITRKNIKVISARSLYGRSFPNNMQKWKLEAFLSLKKKFDSEILTNLVIIGDSEIEIQAGKTLSEHFKQCLVKTIKFKECPRLEELSKEQKIVNDLFDEIFMGCKNMSIRLGKSSSF